MKKVILLIIVISGLTLMGCDKIQQFPVSEKGEPFPCWYMRGLIQTSGKEVKVGDDTAKSILASHFTRPCIRSLAFDYCKNVMATEEGKERFSSFEKCTDYFGGVIK